MKKRNILILLAMSVFIAVASFASSPGNKANSDVVVENSFTTSFDTIVMNIGAGLIVAPSENENVIATIGIGMPDQARSSVFMEFLDAEAELKGSTNLKILYSTEPLANLYTNNKPKVIAYDPRSRMHALANDQGHQSPGIDMK